MSLERAKYWLAWLKAYLPCNTKGIVVRHSKACDESNEADPRAFCMVVEGSKAILCSKELDRLPNEAIVGILLHEIVHMIIGMGNQPDDEVAVDTWILEMVPEAGYKYKAVDYLPSWSNEVVTAKNIEVVSARFLNLIEA